MALLEIFKFILFGRKNYFSRRSLFNFAVTALTGVCFGFLSASVFKNQQFENQEDIHLQWSLELGHMLVLAGSINLLLKLADFELFGNVVYCALEFLLSLIALMGVYVLALLMAFGYFFHIRLDAEEARKFEFQDLVTRPLSMMIGINIAVKDFQTPASNFTQGTVEFVIIFFIFLMCITCCQFLLSLTVNQMDLFLKKGALMRLQNTAIITSNAFLLSDRTLEYGNLTVEKGSKESYWNQFIGIFVHAQRHYEQRPTVFYKATSNINQTILFLPSWIIDQAEDILKEADKLKEKKSDKDVEQKKEEELTKKLEELLKEVKKSNEVKKSLEGTIDRQQQMIASLLISQQDMIENQREQLLNQEKRFSAQMKDFENMQKKLEKLSNGQTVKW